MGELAELEKAPGTDRFVGFKEEKEGFQEIEDRNTKLESWNDCGILKKLYQFLGFGFSWRNVTGGLDQQTRIL